MGLKVTRRRDANSDLRDGIFHDEHVCDGAKLAEVFAKFLRRRLPREAADEKLARSRIR